MTRADTARLRAGAARFGVELEPPAVERLDRFLALLALWNRRVHLTGDRDPAIVVAKHAVDSLAVVPVLPRHGPVVDVGSGAGFPGIVLACVRPGLEMILLEARRRPTSFLREVIRTIPLPRARALEVRAEDAARHPDLAGRVRGVVARAVRLDVFLALAAPLVADDGVVIAMQTPRTARGADAIGAAHGFRLEESRDYALPDGEARRLLVFRPLETTPGTVS